MAITRPTTKTVISTDQWGIPITDAVNTNSTDITTINGKITPTAWTNVTFMNGWGNYTTGGYVTQYQKIGTLVYIRGGVQGGTIGASPVFNLPVGFRPPVTYQFATPSWAMIGYFDVQTNGNIVPTSGDNRFLGMTCVFSTV